MADIIAIICWKLYFYFRVTVSSSTGVETRIISDQVTLVPVGPPAGASSLHPWTSVLYPPDDGARAVFPPAKFLAGTSFYIPLLYPLAVACGTVPGIFCIGFSIKPNFIFFFNSLCTRAPRKMIFCSIFRGHILS